LALDALKFGARQVFRLGNGPRALNDIQAKRENLDHRQDANQEDDDDHKQLNQRGAFAVADGLGAL
jgi:hypothetical protein